jgi:hypothetical protein
MCRETGGAAGEQEAGVTIRVGDQRHRDRRMPAAIERHRQALVRREMVADATLEIGTEGRKRHRLHA